VTQHVHLDLGARSYDIVIGAGALDELAAALASRRKVAVVSQDGVLAVQGARLRRALAGSAADHEEFTIGEGEDAKSLATVDHLCRAFAEWGLLRGDVLVAFGGGVVGDAAGFAASVYYRGIDIVQVPTTLLAMVDSAIGGKTGVNLPEGKNLVGAFHQPRAVFVEPHLLTTLPDREFRCGLGEVVKYALLGDDELTTLLEDQRNSLLARDEAVLGAVITRCVAAKAAVVARDEYEQTGARATLNLGHTVGHAIESAAGYSLAHGEAVAVGLVFAMHLAGALERITPDVRDRAVGLVTALGLPVAAPPGLRGDELLAIMGRDKKADGGLTFVLPGPNGVERVDDPDRLAIDKAFAAIGVVE
jgi:5-deoxy-5-amino-3-dehydroquinate synthase